MKRENNNSALLKYISIIFDEKIKMLETFEAMFKIFETKIDCMCVPSIYELARHF